MAFEGGAQQKSAVAAAEQSVPHFIRFSQKVCHMVACLWHEINSNLFLAGLLKLPSCCKNARKNVQLFVQISHKSDRIGPKLSDLQVWPRSKLSSALRTKVIRQGTFCENQAKTSTLEHKSTRKSQKLEVNFFPDSILSLHAKS